MRYCKIVGNFGYNNLITKVLTEKGYDFYECPRKAPVIKPIGEVREFIDDETGEIVKYSYNQLVSIIGEE